MDWAADERVIDTMSCAARDQRRADLDEFRAPVTEAQYRRVRNTAVGTDLVFAICGCGDSVDSTQRSATGRRLTSLSNRILLLTAPATP